MIVSNDRNYGLVGEVKFNIILTMVQNSFRIITFFDQVSISNFLSSRVSNLYNNYQTVSLTYLLKYLKVQFRLP
jgi:hypothetical protein